VRRFSCAWAFVGRESGDADGKNGVPTAKTEHATDGSSLLTMAVGEPLTAMASA
jgi:hypothetical protein